MYRGPTPDKRLKIRISHGQQDNFRNLWNSREKTLVHPSFPFIFTGNLVN
jgi:hypothetical protein